MHATKSAISRIRLYASPSHLFLAFLLLPLLYIPDAQSSTRLLRLCIFVGIVVTGLLLHYQAVLSHLNQLSRNTRIAVGLLFTSIAVTWVVLFANESSIMYLGFQPDYFGLVAWVAVLFAGMLFGKEVSGFFEQRRTLLIFLAVLVVALVYEQYNLRYGLPLYGTLYTPSALPTYALLGVILSLNAANRLKDTFTKIIASGLFVVSTTVILTSQRLLSLLIFTMIVIYWGLFVEKNRTRKIIYLLVAVVALLLPLILSNYFSGTIRQNITKDVAETSSKMHFIITDFAPSNLLYGHGSGTLPDHAHSTNYVPPSSYKGMQFQTQLGDRHSLFYDTYYYFGVVGFIALVMLSITAVWRSVKLLPKSPAVVMSFYVLLIYSLMFPPNLELTTLYFVFIFSLCSPFANYTKKPTPGYRKLVSVLCICVFVVSLWWIGQRVFYERQPAPEASTQIAASLNSHINDVMDKTIRSYIKATQAVRGSAMILDAKTGTIIAMSEAVTTDTRACSRSLACDNSDQSSLLKAWEPGSTMKPLLLAAALDSGKVATTDSYDVDTKIQVKDRIFYDALSFPEQTVSATDMVIKSRNTGAVRVFEQFGPGQQGRELWYHYLTDRYMFGKPTGLSSSDHTGTVRKPSGGRGIEVQYASSGFGLGVTVTPVQLAAAYAALVNGGIYHSPRLSSQAENPKQQRVLSPETSENMKQILHDTFKTNNTFLTPPAGYRIGAKSGTLPAPLANGTYAYDSDNGTYIGYVEYENQLYIVFSTLNEPRTIEFASMTTARMWSRIVDDLISSGQL